MPSTQRAPRAGAPARPNAPPAGDARRTLAWVFVVGGVLTYALAELGLALGAEPFETWFYDLAWWPAILVIDGWLYLRTGASLVLSRPRAFALLLPWSCAFWLAYEAQNLVLENWYYVGLPVGLASRQIGIALSFATVLPAVLELERALASLGLARRATCAPRRLSPRAARVTLALGAAFLVLPLAFPRYAYPLVWGALVLLVEPWLQSRGHSSLGLDLAHGRPGRVLRGLVAGALCGLLWEAWNFRALAGWIYTVPFFERAKLFEMPFLGFLGFPPFALGCLTFARALVALRLVPECDVDLPVRSAAPWRASLGLALALVAAGPVLVGLERETVRSTVALVRELDGMPAGLAAQLEELGIVRAGQLVEAARAGRTPASFAVERRRAERWLAEAELMGVARMGARGSAWLRAAGVGDARALAAVEPDALLAQLAAVAGPAPAPTPPEVRVWLRRARRALAGQRSR